MVRYIKELDSEGNVRTDVIVKLEDDIKCFVPCYTGNKDYKDYQDWLALGNTPEEIVPEESE